MINSLGNDSILASTEVFEIAAHRFWINYGELDVYVDNKSYGYCVRAVTRCMIFGTGYLRALYMMFMAIEEYKNIPH